MKTECLITDSSQEFDGVAKLNSLSVQYNVSFEKCSLDISVEYGDFSIEYTKKARLDNENDEDIFLDIKSSEFTFKNSFVYKEDVQDFVTMNIRPYFVVVDLVNKTVQVFYDLS